MLLSRRQFKTSINFDNPPSVLHMVEFKKNTTWKIPPFIRYIDIFVIGGGGGPGGLFVNKHNGYISRSGGGGGNGANTAIILNKVVTPGVVIDITIGEGGEMGISDPWDPPSDSNEYTSIATNGKDGGTTYFGSYLSADGGVAGTVGDIGIGGYWGFSYNVNGGQGAYEKNDEDGYTCSHGYDSPQYGTSISSHPFLIPANPTICGSGNGGTIDEVNAIGGKGIPSDLKYGDGGSASGVNFAGTPGYNGYACVRYVGWT